MKKAALFAILLTTIIGCRNSTKQSENETKSDMLEAGCYVYNNNGNNIKMEITEISDSVRAKLNIAYAEKDVNQGTFVGTLNGDKLIGKYTFNSEGMESVREMAFLVKDHQLIEGYGELNENGTAFKDVNAIKYTSTMPLTRAECDNGSVSCLFEGPIKNIA